MRLCKCGCGEALPSSAFHRRLFLNVTHRNRYHEVRRGHGDRPAEIACVRCGRIRPVAAKGTIPRFCGLVCAEEYTKEYRRAATVQRLATWRCSFCAGAAKVTTAGQKYCPECINRASRLWKHGMTVEDWVAMGRAQGWRCAICPAGGDRASAIDLLCIDHCHDTGQIRGLLCRTCNTGIGHLRDDLTLVRRAAEYLEAAQKPQLRLVG